MTERGDWAMKIEGIDILLLKRAIRILLPCATMILLTAVPGFAEPFMTGTFHCKSLEIAGKVSPCRAPALELKADGSFEMLSEHGTYEIIKGDRLILSPSKSGSMARLSGDNEIIFEYISGGKKFRIVYHRKFERDPGDVAT
jgi:hypothetical protein